MGTLFVVSTPIGNLDDLTRRAEATLAQVDRILAEDTRRTRVLLDHIGCRTPSVSLNEHNERGRIGQVSGWLDAGEELALVSDAGTPLLSDPGRGVVAAAIEGGHRVVPIPGASALLSALVASGLPLDAFVFLGFPPRRGGERTRLVERVAESRETVVLYEAPGRLTGLLRDLAEVSGEGRQVSVARELTKLHEEFFRGSLAEAAVHFEGTRVRGEVTVVVSPAVTDPGPDVEERTAEARSLARALLAAGARASEAAREVSDRTGVPRNEAYSLVHELEGSG